MVRVRGDSEVYVLVPNITALRTWIATIEETWAFEGPRIRCFYDLSLDRLERNTLLPHYLLLFVIDRQCQYSIQSRDRKQHLNARAPTGPS